MHKRSGHGGPRVNMLSSDKPSILDRFRKKVDPKELVRKWQVSAENLSLGAWMSELARHVAQLKTAVWTLAGE